MTRYPGRFLAAICAAGAIAVFCLPISNPDIYWHLSAGRWVFANGAFPRADWLSHSFMGAPWADFEWLTQCLWHIIEGVGGFRALWGFKAGLLGCSSFVLWRMFSLYKTPSALRGLLILIWALAISPANDLRPENFSLLAFLLLLYVLEARRMGQWRPSFKRVAVFSAIFFSVWANLHAGFIYGLILLALYASVGVLEKKETFLLKTSLLGAAAVLFNPYGFLIYRIPWEHWLQLDVLARNIHEWQEPTLWDVWLLPFWSLLVISFSFLFVRYVRKKDVPLEHIGAMCLFSLSSAAHVRTSVYFVCVSIPVLAWLFSTLTTHWKRAGVFLYGTSLMACAVFFFSLIFPVLRQGQFQRDVYVPVRLANFLHEEEAFLSRLRLFNPWHWGGYLGYRLSPSYLVFVDGRYIFHSLLEPIAAARKTPEAYGAFLKMHKIDLAVIAHLNQQVQVPVGRGEAPPMRRPFYLFYFPKTEWALIYWDAKSLGFVRRSSVDSEWLNKKEYRYFRPGDFDALERLVREKHVRPTEIQGEMERRFAHAPHSQASRESRQWLERLKKQVNGE